MILGLSNMDEQTCQGIKRNFLEALQVSALPSSEQIRLTVPACVTCELYEDFVSSFAPFLECYQDTLSDSQKKTLCTVANKLELVPEEGFICFDNTVLEQNAWQVVRQFATNALSQMNWELKILEPYQERESGVWQRPETQ